MNISQAFFLFCKTFKSWKPFKIQNLKVWLKSQITFKSFNSDVMINLQNQSEQIFRTFLADYILLIYMSVQFILVYKPPPCEASVRRYDRLKILPIFWLSPGFCVNRPSDSRLKNFLAKSCLTLRWDEHTKKNLGFAFSFWRNGDFRKTFSKL